MKCKACGREIGQSRSPYPAKDNKGKRVAIGPDCWKRLQAIGHLAGLTLWTKEDEAVKEAEDRRRWQKEEREGAQ